MMALRSARNQLLQLQRLQAALLAERYAMASEKEGSANGIVSLVNLILDNLAVYSLLDCARLVILTG